MKCPTCQHEVKGRFCSNCGTDMQQAMDDAQQQRPGGPDPNATARLSAADLAAYTARMEGSPHSAPGAPQQPGGQPSGPGDYQQPGSPYAPPGGPISYRTGYPPPGDPPPYAAGGGYPGGPGNQGAYGSAQPPYGTGYPQQQVSYHQEGQYAPPQAFPQPGAATAAPPRRRRRGLWILGGILVVILAIGALAVAALVLKGKSNNGTVKFGTSYTKTGGDYSVQNEKTSFGPSEKLAWVAYLNDTVDPKSITRTVARVNGDGTTTTILSAPLNISASGNVNRVSSTLTVADLEGVGIKPPGKYRVTYFSNGKKEATGTLRLTGASVAGKIFFGTAMSDSLVTGQSTQSSFGPKDPFDYVAHFNQTAGAAKVSVRFFFITSDGSERQVDNGTVTDTVSGPGAWQTKDDLTVARIRGLGVTRPGIYILRYYRGTTVLAEGQFTIHA